MSFISEFKEFAVKGNMIDLAVGVIIGGAFGKIITALVDDLIMPIISWILGGKVDFSNMFIVLGKNPDNLTTLVELKAKGIATLAYGDFITVFINFLLLALAVFLLVKGVNSLRKEQEVETPVEIEKEEVTLLREIRNSLAK